MNETFAGPATASPADSALSTQVGGSHYREGAIQPVQYAEANGLHFLEACVVKRVTRHNRDGGKGRQDIEKAIHELQLLLELRYPSAPETAVEGGATGRTKTTSLGANPGPETKASPTISGTLQNFLSRGKAFGDLAEWDRLVAGFLKEYFATGNRKNRGFSDITPEHAEIFAAKLIEANDCMARGCTNVALHYDPDFEPENSGFYLTWLEPETDSNIEKTNLENPKCQAIGVKSEATVPVDAGLETDHYCHVARSLHHFVCATDQAQRYGLAGGIGGSSESAMSTPKKD